MAMKQTNPLASCWDPLLTRFAHSRRGARPDSEIAFEQPVMPVIALAVIIVAWNGCNIKMKVYSRPWGEPKEVSLIWKHTCLVHCQGSAPKSGGPAINPRAQGVATEVPSFHGKRGQTKLGVWCWLCLLPGSFPLHTDTDVAATCSDIGLKWATNLFPLDIVHKWKFGV